MGERKEEVEKGRRWDVEERRREKMKEGKEKVEVGKGIKGGGGRWNRREGRDD